MIKNGFRLVKKTFSFFSKVFIVVAVFFTVINIFLTLSKTDRNTNLSQDTNVVEEQRAQMYEMFNLSKVENPTDKVTMGIYKGFTCLTVGELCTDNPKDADANFDSSFIGSISNFMVMPYMNPPASGVGYALNMIQDASFVPRAYAYEGFGFASLKGYIKIWNLFRNLTYLILVLIIIAIGFMIMFRMKINPQTVIGIENSLPRIVIALILITFSFAIAGFLIDIMYVIIGLTIYTFSQLNVGILEPSNLLNLQNKYIGASMGDIWPIDGFDSAINTGSSMFNILPVIVRVPLRVFAGWIMALTFSRVVATWGPLGKVKDSLENVGIQAATFGFSSGKLTNWIFFPLELLIFAVLFNWMPAVLMGLIIMLTVLFLTIRIFFILITSYIKIILFVIFAPILLLFEAIPGRNTFSFWIKSLIGELIAFPLVIVLSLAGYAIIQINGSGQAFALPFINGFSSKEFGTIIGLGIILVIPDLIKVTRGAMGLKDLPVNFGINTFFGGATVPIGGGIGMMSQYGMLAMHMPALRKLPKLIPYLGNLFEDEAKSASGTPVPGTAAANPPTPPPNPQGGGGGAGGPHTP